MDESSEKDGIFLLALPDATLELVRKLSLSMGKSFPDVVSDGIRILAERELTSEKPKEGKPKVKVSFR